MQMRRHRWSTSQRLAGVGIWLLRSALLVVLTGGVPPAGALLPAAAAEQPAIQPGPSGLPIAIKIGVPSKTDDFIPVYLAQDLGIFERHGLQATIFPMTSSVAVPALQSGELDFWVGAGSGAKAAEAGRPIRIVFVSSDAPGQLIIGAKGTKSLRDLRGGAVAVKVPLDTTTLVTQYLLKQAGVPADAYQLIYARTTDTEISLLVSGKVVAANLETGPGLQMEALGYPILATANRVKVLGTGLVTSLTEIKNKPDVIHRTIAAVKEALHMIVTDKARTVAVMEREFGETHEIASRAYDLAKGRWLPDGVPPAEAIRNEIALDTEALRDAHVSREAPIRPEDILDLSFLQPGAPAGRPGTRY